LGVFGKAGNYVGSFETHSDGNLYFASDHGDAPALEDLCEAALKVIATALDGNAGDGPFLVEVEARLELTTGT
jgi:hypothetical protein